MVHIDIQKDFLQVQKLNATIKSIPTLKLSNSPKKASLPKPWPVHSIQGPIYKLEGNPYLVLSDKICLHCDASNSTYFEVIKDNPVYGATGDVFCTSCLLWKEINFCEKLEKEDIPLYLGFPFYHKSTNKKLLHLFNKPLLNQDS